MRKIVPVLILLLAAGCGKPYPSVDELLPPGTFNLGTVITDSEGNSLDLAGDWAVFQDPEETIFTNYLHYDQTTETVFSVTYNTSFMMEYVEGRQTLPVYQDGRVDKRRSLFIQGASNEIIYKDGRVHLDFRKYYLLYNAPYGSPFLHTILDEDTIGFEDKPDVRLRRIWSFAD